MMPGPLVDIGSGGGVPGLVLGVVRPERELHLVEATARKAGFLRATARADGRGRDRARRALGRSRARRRGLARRLRLRLRSRARRAARRGRAVPPVRRAAGDVCCSGSAGRRRPEDVTAAAASRRRRARRVVDARPARAREGGAHARPLPAPSRRGGPRPLLLSGSRRPRAAPSPPPVRSLRWRSAPHLRARKPEGRGRQDDHRDQRRRLPGRRRGARAARRPRSTGERLERSRGAPGHVCPLDLRPAPWRVARRGDRPDVGAEPRSRAGASRPRGRGDRASGAERSRRGDRPRARVRGRGLPVRDPRLPALARAC